MHELAIAHDRLMKWAGCVMQPIAPRGINPVAVSKIAKGRRN
jgi:hypothetical protein